MAEMDRDVLGQLVQEVFAQADGPKRLLEYLLNRTMAAEASAHVAAAPHERTDRRRGHRNGYKPRTLATRVGELELSVPQVRSCEPYHPSMFAKWQRSERALLVACAEMYFQGVKDLMADLVIVFAPEERAECLQRGEEMAARWEGRYPAGAKMLREGLEDCLAVLDFPSHHRRRLQSTNMLETLMKRLKKRSRVVGVFPNRAACDRLLGAQLLEVHETWAVEEKIYFNMEYGPVTRNTEPLADVPPRALGAA